MTNDDTDHYIGNPQSASAVPPPPIVEFPGGKQVQGHVIDFCRSPTEPDSDDSTSIYDSEKRRETIQYRSHSDSERWYCSHQVHTDISPIELNQTVCAGAPTLSERLSIYSPPPTSVREYIGILSPDPDIKRRDALITIGRLCGVKTPYDSSLKTVQSAIDQLEISSVPDITTARRRVADAGADVERLRERVAMLRGQMAVYRETDVTTDITNAEIALKNAIRTLSEASTEEIAATQRLTQLIDIARTARDCKEKRLSLIDRRQNLKRHIRAEIFDVMKAEFDRVRQVPWIAERIDGNNNYTTALADAIAILSLAPLRAPLIVAESVATAFDGISALAIRINATIIVSTTNR
jgi:hypothetical protein